MAPTAERQRATWFRVGYPDQQMRVSDAERAEVAERLARHYADGRLDKAEFDERVSRAMAAKTAGDFQGLFEDLPHLPPDGAPGTGKADPPPPPAYATQRQPGRRRGPVRSLLGLAVLIIAAWIALHIVAAIAWHLLFGWASPLAWIGVAVVIVLAVKALHRR